jgi:hypothetical protein
MKMFVFINITKQNYAFKIIVRDMQLFCVMKNNNFLLNFLEVIISKFFLNINFKSLKCRSTVTHLEELLKLIQLKIYIKPISFFFRYYNNLFGQNIRS